jgi:hypothetical protein
MTTQFWDPTLTIEPTSPGTETITIAYLGETLVARVAGPQIAAGGLVTVVRTAGMAWAMKRAGGYPSQHEVPLGSWMQRAPASMVMRYVLDFNPHTYRYQLVTVESSRVGGAVAAIRGELRDLPVEWAGDPAIVDVGTALAWCRSGEDDWVIIGRVEDPFHFAYYNVRRYALDGSMSSTDYYEVYAWVNDQGRPVEINRRITLRDGDQVVAPVVTVAAGSVLSTPGCIRTEGTLTRSAVMRLHPAGNEYNTVGGTWSDGEDCPAEILALDAQLAAWSSENTRVVWSDEFQCWVYAGNLAPGIYPSSGTIGYEGGHYENGGWVLGKYTYYIQYTVVSELRSASYGVVETTSVELFGRKLAT